MLRNMMKGLIIGFGLLALVCTAQADQEINIFGASAQFKYWTEGAPSFVMSNFVGCPAADTWHAVGDLDSRDSGITVCNYDMNIVDENDQAITSTGGSTVYSGENVIIRYATFASAEGLLAAREENPSGADAACGDAGQRLLADEANTNFTSSATIPAPGGGVKANKCVDITLGTSDIDPECFTQRTYGPWTWDQFDGGIGSKAEWDAAQLAWDTSGDDTDWAERIFIPGNPLPETPWAGMSKANPFVVPFAFFRNNGNPAVPVNNLTRAMAQMIYSGQVANWSTFDPNTDLQVKVCIRHAGSGTHATLDWAVVRAPGVNMVQNAAHPDYVLPAAGLAPVVLTNKGSSDNVECSGDNIGAISYADADKLSTNIAGDNAVDCTSDSKGENCRLTYQGYEATRANVRNCKYDFWGANVVYYQNDENSQLLQDLVAFSEDPANMAAGHQNFWASQGELKCDRLDCKSPIKVK